MFSSTEEMIINDLINYLVAIAMIDKRRIDALKCYFIDGDSIIRCSNASGISKSSLREITTRIYSYSLPYRYKAKEYVEKILRNIDCIERVAHFNEDSREYICDLCGFTTNYFLPMFNHVRGIHKNVVMKNVLRILQKMY